MNLETDPAPSAQALRKPRFSYLIATSLGLGYLRPAPGTWGSLAGAFVACISWWFPSRGIMIFSFPIAGRQFDPILLFQIAFAVGVAFIGVFAATRVSTFSGVKDPQYVVIDEVSGQHLTLLIGGFGPGRVGLHVWDAIGGNHPLSIFGDCSLNWKYLLLGFILFRGFDIWKPFPVRQLESLPGGWGIMADDWGAAVYAAAGLWIARALGL
jgi:phosphatidylglycerophosphatase A